MKLKSHSGGGRSEIAISAAPDSSGDLPTHGIFANSSQGMSSRTSTHASPSSGYYQVTTPKSPHELTFEEVDGNTSNEMEHELVGTASVIGPSECEEHGSKCGKSGISKSSRKSEEVERLTYETAKAEILEKLHLHVLLGNKRVQGIQTEIRRIGAHMKLLETLHDDKGLLDKIESYQEGETERKKRQIVTEMNYTTAASLSNNSSGYHADNSSILAPPSTSNYNLPLSTSNNTHVPIHHYHTRSKSHGNSSEISLTASSNVVPSGVDENFPHFRANQMNLHHRRNYSSTCLTSNSGVVGKTDNNEAIFRRYDGILIVITCSHCDRKGFTSAQGIVNHARLKHNKTYSSQPLAVLNNQILLPNEKQDPEVLQKFKNLGRDPQKEYLPSELAIPSMAKRELGPRSGLPNTKSSVLQPERKTMIPQQQHADVSDTTKHLKKVYGKEDFEDLIGMVKSTNHDLDNVLKEESAPSSGSEVSEMGGEHDHEAEASFNKASSPLSPSRDIIKGNKKKRKRDQNDALRDYKDRMRPAEKRARPDVLALTAIPEHEERSSHYNLRAKSKIRSTVDRYD